MNKEIKDYYKKRMEEEGISVLPGHEPKFESKAKVDSWIKMTRNVFDEYFKNDNQEDI